MPKVTVVGRCQGEIEVSQGAALLEIANQFADKFDSPIVVAKVNNDIKELTYPIDTDCKVELLDLRTSDGVRVYQRSVVLLFIRAARELFPGCRVTIEHSLSNGLFGELYTGNAITHRDLERIENRMWQLVKEDIPFEKKLVSKAEALSIFENDGQQDKVRLLRYREDESVKVYKCGWYQDYFYGYMVPSTGYLKQFKVIYYLPGFIIQVPEPGNPNSIPEYKEQRKLATAFAEAERWGRILGVGDVGSLDDQIESGMAGDLVRIAEALHEKKVAQLADIINTNKENLRVVLIAGPSSSGKTTFAQRLSIQLRVNGLRPVSISLDDYFVSRSETPLDENGNLDFEALETIDLPLFNEDLQKLIQGEAIDLPTFNFLNGQREYRGKKLQIGADQPIIIEGIHGLNDRLTATIPKNNKFKIYVSAITTLNIDDHNRIPTTDVRLIRRIVRDSKFRSHDALQTIKMWPSVRRGEEKNIFPFQEDADAMFNSALVYELGVLKNFAEPLLAAVPPETEEFSEAKRLRKFLSYFRPIDDKEIPCNSIMREFVGGSCFHQ